MVAGDEFQPFLAAVRGAYGAARDAEGELAADLEVWLAALDGLGGARVAVDPEDQPVCRHLAAPAARRRHPAPFADRPRPAQQR